MACLRAIRPVCATSKAPVRAPVSSRLAVPVVAPARTRVLVRATPSSGEDPSAKYQEQLNEVAEKVKAKWDATPDAEKPAVVGIILLVTIAQIAIGASVDAINRIPFISSFLEFVGLAVVGVYGYRYFTDPDERTSLKKSVDSFVDNVTGK